MQPCPIRVMRVLFYILAYIRIAWLFNYTCLYKTEMSVHLSVTDDQSRDDVIVDVTYHTSFTSRTPGSVLDCLKPVLGRTVPKN